MVIHSQVLGEFEDHPGLGLGLANPEEYDGSWIRDEENTIVHVTLRTAVRFVWKLIPKNAYLYGVRLEANALRDERDLFCEA
jgi:hypothetical protein